MNHRTVNNAMGNNNSNKKGKKKKNGKNKYNNYISKEDWAKLSKEEREAIQKERKTKQEKSNNSGQMTGNNIPMQYGGHSMSNNAMMVNDAASMLQVHLSYAGAVMQSQQPLESNAIRAAMRGYCYELRVSSHCWHWLSCG
jgi:hypothetical protein